jgi:preprotein translocase subunit YajC
LYALLFTLFSFLQPEASGGAPVATPTSTGGGGGAAATPFGSGLSGLALPVLLMVFLYLFMIRPQQKKQKELDGLLKQLKKGQKVRTTGGIRGEIVDFKSEAGDEVVLLIGDRMKINILRSHIAGTIEGSSTAEEPKT